MKKVILAIMLLAAIKSNAQTKVDNKVNGFYIPQTVGRTGSSFTIQPQEWTTEEARLKAGSDTLEVFYGKIKYIKIGADIFEITSPSLKKVEPFILGSRSAIRPYYYSTPNSSQ